MMRQISEQILTIVAWLALTLGVQADGLVSAIVTDPLTGVAIEGYDPVSYFTDPEPQQGRPEFEYDWGGVPWYFESAANRDVFRRNPTVYAPQFGGHCLTSLSRGYLSDGKPRLYVIEAMKLYFFYSTANRDAFLLSKADVYARAEANWQNLSKGLPVKKPEESAPSSEPSGPAEAAPVAQDSAKANVPAH